MTGSNGICAATGNIQQLNNPIMEASSSGRRLLEVILKVILIKVE
jgi:hypothetical protein